MKEKKKIIALVYRTCTLYRPLRRNLYSESVSVMRKWYRISLARSKSPWEKRWWTWWIPPQRLNSVGRGGGLLTGSTAGWITTALKRRPYQCWDPHSLKHTHTHTRPRSDAIIKKKEKRKKKKEGNKPQGALALSLGELWLRESMVLRPGR